MPLSGIAAYSKFAYNFNVRCGFLEMYAVQEWGQLQYAARVGSNLTISR
jgi:hypothetical protein